MAVMSGKILQNVSVAHHCQQNRQFHTQQSRDFLNSKLRSFLPFGGRRLAWNDILAMRLRTLPISESGFVSRGTVYSNAASSASAVPSLEKNDFLKLQNGSDIRGVAVAGVEGEPVTLTEPVSEAIAAAFAAWLADKKKNDASRPMRVSIGHDSRISASKLQKKKQQYDVLYFGMFLWLSDRAKGPPLDDLVVGEDRMLCLGDYRALALRSCNMAQALKTSCFVACHFNEVKSAGKPIIPNPGSVVENLNQVKAFLVALRSTDDFLTN
ncbi:hypothetical protein Cgig2_008348 [Carnegiea gigantea]|uniref:Uncharacterized protein n=1 Tax=Carnegiea gigantea TaxID=171969 RepID=A0A9Q1QAL3_9CARY|nr:hypothetical protein Cgig2_008348 [Carnegiea gigantea]